MTAKVSPVVPSEPLLASFEALVCDLDGVVYQGPAPIADAVVALQWASDAGRRIIYATNNASRTPRDVAEHLTSFGLKVVPDDVITSSVAGAHVLAGQVAGGSVVLAVGGAGVSAALMDEGLQPVAPPGISDAGSDTAGAKEGAGSPSSSAVVAVLQGYGPSVTAADLAEVAYAVQRGARWVATNTDRTLPTDRGLAPGNGSLVSAVRLAVDIDPEVVGKPAPTMYRMAAERIGVPPSRVLAIGDRLETDIEGAVAAGMPSLLVLTGVHGPVDLLRVPPQLRPDYVVSSLAALGEPYVAPSRVDRGWTCGAAVGQVTNADVEFASGGGTNHVPESRKTTGIDSDEVGMTLEGGGDERIRVGLAVLWDAIDHGSLSVDDAVRLWRSSVAEQSSRSS